MKKFFALDNPLRLLYHKLRAIAANIVYGFPSKGMVIIGVTGTNGKTTTSNIIAKGLIASGKKVFMFTTVNIIIGDNEYVNDTKMTSPDAFLLQRLFKQAKDEGCEIAVIETASHGIKMSRVWGLEYDIAVLTNITQDHLDLHKTMKDYVNTKLRLFKELISYERKPGIKKTAVINVGSEYSELFVNETYDSVYLYGKGNGASLVAKDIRIENGLTKFEIKLPGKTITIQTKLKGEFNVENILAAIGVFLSFSISTEDIQKVILSVTGVPGRMELIDNEIGADIIVDYAHTPDALEKVLTTLKEIGYKKIVTVFGATGDRDKTKRPIMGEVVSKNSDVVILTQDDDYTENSEMIIKDVIPGINRIEGQDFFIIPTRKEAIELGISSIGKGDALLIAGKGDEHVMVTNKGAIEWHDKTIIKQILKEIDDNKIIV
ncbi:MAG: UDP-N-acetylmuramoyl-L-alanyl-D-glutamate--2,6-diaminopimelate ligase [Candidatus Gracilibacteria bacterium]|nr:UDP-N-acetylmuramoyl-L-alanyl-D-glutamate--2,6-diaminopimelate ligase [Candidatus Gracilibacteria bacterium]